MWTIQLIPTSGPSVERTLADVGNDVPFWGVSKANIALNAMNSGTLAMEVEGDFLQDPLFPQYARIVLWRDRKLSKTGTGTGGTRFFQGIVTQIKPSATGASETVSYTVNDPWWYLTKLVYEQQLSKASIQPQTTHVVLNVDMANRFGRGWGVALEISKQLQDILDNSITQGAVLSFVVGDLPDAMVDSIVLFPPTDEKRDIPCDEAIKAELRWVPDCVPWVDYGPATPVLHFTRRATMTPVMFDLLQTNVKVTSASILPRRDLQVAQCIIRFEQKNQVGSNTKLAIYEDKYPLADPAVPWNILRATVNLMGVNATEQEQEIESRDMAYAEAQTGPDPDDDGAPAVKYPFWIEKHPWLRKVTDLTIHDVNRTGSLEFELVDGTVHPWMNVNNDPTDDQVLCVQETVTCRADFTDASGSIQKDVEIHCRVKTTNGEGGLYTRLKLTQAAEPIPFGLAQWMYNILSVLQYDGEIAIESDEVSNLHLLGCTINLANGLTEWETMNATIQGVAHDLFSGRTSVKFGPNRYLNPGELIDILRTTRARYVSSYSSMVTTGTTEQDEITLGKDGPRENSIVAPPAYEKLITSAKDPDTEKTTKITKDAINQSFTMESDDATKPRVDFNFQDLLDNAALNP